jgi:hypothetical protein
MFALGKSRGFAPAVGVVEHFFAALAEVAGETAPGSAGKARHDDRSPDDGVQRGARI